MKICLISVEIFAWGKYGGFGRATRLIGRELTKKGIEVTAVVPMRDGQKPVEKLDGFTVFGFDPHRPWLAVSLFKKCDADIYHSCEPSFGTFLAMRTMPNKKHIVTCRDPRDTSDWKMEYALPSLNKLQVIFNYVYENNLLVRRSVRKMDGVYTTAYCLIPKVKSIYKLHYKPQFLPTPVDVPQVVKKAKIPTVCFVARFDRRKRPEIFLKLAKKHPEIQFIAVGKSRDESWDAYLRKKYGDIPNLEMTGFVDQFNSDRLSRIYAKSWVMVNTATREGLANSFIEAAAHKCAILSHVDPDGFASKFGYWARENEFDDGLKFLLKNNKWYEKGSAGQEYVKRTFSLDGAIERHLEVYYETVKN